MSQAIIQRACAKLRSAIGDEAVVRLNFTADLRHMLVALEAIQPMLGEAEIRPLWDTSASDWLCLARAAAYRTIDTVNELQDARPQAAATMTKILPRLAIMKNVMAIQVQETKEIVMWAQEQLGALSKYWAENTIMSQEIIEERKTGPVFEEAMVLGRGSDKERIIATLLSTEPNIMQEHITILPIFGLAGSGKTTLAQMIFNDTHSLQGYDFRVWVHVSPRFDFHTIGKFIICHVSGRGQEEINHSSSDMEGMESIMKRLHELLNLKKVLLVLDDLWEEDPIQLQLLKSMLTFLGSKVDVIVTTGNQSIARKICTIEPYRLNPLSDDTCWEIIKRNSIHFEKEDKDEELEKIGREMASRCCGVPSAAPAFAGLLDFYRDDWKWEGTMLAICSKLLLPISTIDLSYRSMPPDLKLCFAYYCVIFQGGHNIVKDDLVHHWIALNLIESSEVLSATQIAEEHITRLLDMSFLQTAKSDHVSAKDDKGGILFTMHNLVHDLVRRFAGRSSYCLAINHHGQLDAGYVERQRALRCVGCSKMEFNNDTFSRRKCLRVMELKESAMQKLPDSIWQLSYMGYLKISEFTGLVTLPESFGQLTNLFHVDLSGCSGLQNLPVV